ncbi:MAG: hypothetical protein WC797_04970 [Candidatus Paceibacterota bacterium]|jgi:hypothetical protein
MNRRCWFCGRGGEGEKESPVPKKPRDGSFIATVRRIGSGYSTWSLEDRSTVVLETEDGELRFGAFPFYPAPFREGTKLVVTLGELLAHTNYGYYVTKTDGTVQYTGNSVRWLTITSYKTLA